VTFTDGNGKTVQVSINGNQTSYTANLSLLADGAITSSLLINPDPAGNTFTAVAGNSVSLDTTPPRLLSITQADPSPTNATIVHYTVTFSEPVTGVTASDFSLTTSGLTGASIASVTPVSGSNGAQYTVTVNDGSGDGTLRLNLTGATVQDLAGNLLPGGGTFSTPATYSVGVFPTSVAVADVNGDGKPDLIVGNNGSYSVPGYDASVSVLLGNGDGTFQSPINYGLTAAPLNIAVGDLNGDGSPDIAIVEPGAKVAVLLNNGHGGFQPPVNYSTSGSFPAAVAIGDVTGDGRPDLVVANQNSVTILQGNGEGAFTTWATFGGLNFANSVAIADVDKNGTPDILVTNAGSDAVTVLLNNGNGTFQTRTFNAGIMGNDPQSIAVADLNGDGNPDIVVSNRNSQTVSVLLGNGNGTFQPQVTYSTYTAGGISGPVAVADLNGDGKLDIAVTDRNTNTVSVLLGNGDGTFQPYVSWPSGSTPVGLAVADVNGDKTPDLVTANFSDNTVSVLLNGPTPIAGSAYDIDQDGGEQTALKLTVNGNSATPIGAAGAGTVAFTVTGLDPEDTGVVTFSDGASKVTVTVDGGHTSYTADLTSLADRTITSSLAVNTDPAGNSFTPVAGNNVTLDRDSSAEASSPGLLGYWTFNGTAADTSGNGNTLSLFGDATYGPGQFGQALSLDGSATGYAQEAADNTAFDFGSNDFTIQVWAKFNTITNGREETLIEKFSDRGGPGWTLTLQNGNNIQFLSSPAVVLNSGPEPIPNGVWQEFVVERSGNTFDLYWDGNLVAAAASSAPLTSSSNPLLIKARNSQDGRNFTIDGSIDDVGIWNRALSNVEIANSWNGGAGLQLSGEQPTLSFADTLVGSAGAKTVSFTVGGIDPADDTAVITFKDQNGKTTTATVTANGTATADLSMLADGPITASMVVTDTAKNTFNATSSNSATLGQDTGQQAALKLTVNGNSATPIGAGGAGTVALTVEGLDPEDTGVVTFSDGTNHVTVNVNGTQTSYTADLSSLTDGTITSSLAVNTDAAGNTFTPVAGNNVSLDQDSGEQAALGLTVNGNSATPIGAAGAGTVAFTLAGLDPEDTGVVAFGDGTNHITVNVNGGQTSYTADLTSLADGPISSSLSVNVDPAGNSFTGISGNTVTLDTTAPKVTSITQPDPSPTNKSAVQYTVTFSEPVTGVTASDFSVSTNGLKGAAVAGVMPVAGSHGSQYTVTVNDGSGDGTLTLHLNGGSIQDLAGNPLSLPAGGLQPQATYPTGGGPDSVAIADLSGNGISDVVVANDYSHSVSVFLGNANGLLQSGGTYTVPGDPQSVAVGDVNGDGKPDLIVASDYPNAVSVLLGNGDGTFQPAYQTYPVTNASSLAVGDVNGDGKLDLAVTNPNAKTVSVLFGNGNGTFQSPIAVNSGGTYAQGVAIGDLNRDGYGDIVVADDNSPGTVSVLLSNGNGTFHPLQTFSTGPDPQFVTIGDVNGDGIPDLVVAVSNGVSVLLGNGDGTFKSPSTYSTGSLPLSAAIADINGDGVPDLWRRMPIQTPSLFCWGMAMVPFRRPRPMRLGSSHTL
jgi:hypothetical protein